MSMTAEDYVRLIMCDETEKFVRETPILYENARIEREYEFEDGAIVRYEWRDISVGDFNHRFSLIEPPDPNPENLRPGTIRTISF